MPFPSPLLRFSKNPNPLRIYYSNYNNKNNNPVDSNENCTTNTTTTKSIASVRPKQIVLASNRNKPSSWSSKGNVASLLSKKGLTKRSKAYSFSKKSFMTRTGSSMTVMESSMMVERSAVPDTQTNNEGTPCDDRMEEAKDEQSMDCADAAIPVAAVPGTTASALSTYDVTDREFVDPLKRKGRYTGMVKTDTNNPHGSGRMDYNSSKNADLDEVYVDSNGATHAISVLSFEGQWINGDWCGYGTLLLEVQNKALGTKRTVKYQGGFFDNMKHGQGILWYSEDVHDVCFDGLFQLDKMGRGVMKYKDGSSYWGDFASSSLSSSTTTKSSSTNGKKDCAITEYNSYYYYYDLECTKPHGRGKYINADGTIYDGEFECGVMHGHGRMTYTDGSWYLGEWSEGKKNGFGIQVSSNGSLIHEGIFYHDEPIHGSSIPHRQRRLQSDDHLHNSLSQEQYKELRQAAAAAAAAAADLPTRHSSSSLPTDMTDKTEEDSTSSHSTDEILLYRSSLMAKPQSAGVVRAGKASTLVGPIPRELVMRKRLI